MQSAKAHTQLLGSLFDQASVKDQVASCTVMSASQLATTLQLPMGSDPQVLGMGGVSTPMSAAAAWLEQDTSQATMSLLPQGVALPQQQALAAGNWSISAAGPTTLPALDGSPAQLQLQLQALKGDAAALANLSALSAGLPASQGIAAAMDGMPVALQQVPAAPDATSPQVFITASGEQVLLISGTQAEALKQQLGACANMGIAQSAVSAAVSSPEHSSMHLQEAMQRLSKETAAVQQALLGMSGSQAQHKAYSSPVCSMPEGLVSSPAVFDPNTPLLLAPQPMGSYHNGQFCGGSLTASSSPAGSFGGMDSLSSSSWHALTDGQGNNSHSNTSSPSFRLQCKSRLGPSAGSAAGGQGVATLQVLSAPGAPQPSTCFINSMPAGGGGVPAAAAGMAYTPAVASYVPAGTGYVVLSNDASWQAAPAGGSVAAGCPAPGTLLQQPAMYAVCDQGAMMASSQVSSHAVLASQYLQVPQPGRLPTAGGFPAGYLQHPAGRSFKPYGAGRTASGVYPRSKSAGSRPAGAEAAAAKAAAAGEGATGAPSARALATGAYSSIKMQEGLSQLWGQAQLHSAKGGRLFNVQQLAWHPADDPAPCAQDMYNFQKLKRLIQKLDAVHKTRVKLIKRIHAVADHGEGDLKSVYREVRNLIGEMLHASAFAQMKSLEECRVTGLVQLALMLQDALEQGPRDPSREEAAPVA